MNDKSKINSAALNRLLKQAGIQVDSVSRKFYIEDGYVTIITINSAPWQNCHGLVERIKELVLPIAQDIDSRSVVIRRQGGVVWRTAGGRV